MANTQLLTLILTSVLLVPETTLQSLPQNQITNPEISNRYSNVAIKFPKHISIPARSTKFVSPSKVRSINISSFVRNKNDVRLQKRTTLKTPGFAPEGEFSLAERENEILSSATLKAFQYLKELNVSANRGKSPDLRSTSYVCSGNFKDEEFYIHSPNYPLNYPSFISCRYVVHRKSREFCGIHWTILRFDLSSEGSDLDPENCRGDIVRIGTQVLCGRLKKGIESFTPFTSPSLAIAFDSGDGFGSSGFLLQGRQMKTCLPFKPFPKPMNSSVSCNRQILERNFALTSPSFPLNYSHNLECRYEVVQASWEVCGLLLTPLSFEVEGASYCMFDYLEVQGQRLCGNVAPDEPLYYMFERTRLALRFRTDESISMKGFSLEGRQILCNDLENFQPIHSPLAILKSRLDFQTDQDLYNFQDVGRVLPLLVNSGVRSNAFTPRKAKSFITPLEDVKPGSIFHQSNVNFQAVANDPYHSVYDNTTGEVDKLNGNNTHLSTIVPQAFNLSEYPLKDGLLGSFSSSSTPSSVTKAPSSNDQEHPVEEEETLSNSCHTSNSSRVFLIRSVNYPNPYPENIQCAHYIEKRSPDVCQLRLTLEDVDIEKSSNTSALCPSDYLNIAGYRICGTFRNKIINMTFPGNTTVIRFHSDFTTTGRGYLITVEQENHGCENKKEGGSLHCDSTTSHENFTLLSPGYPQSYPPNLQCTTTVYKSSSSITSLEVNFKKFNVESSPQCEKDYFAVGKRRFCGHRNGNTYRIHFPGESLPLIFITDASKSTSGFMVMIRQISRIPVNELGPKCGATFYSSFFTMASPHYPGFYPPDTHCTYTIERNSPDICQLRFRIVTLDIEASPGCRRDYLQLGNLRKICGKIHLNEIHTFHFTNKEFNLTFHSDSEGEGRGFILEVFQKSCQNPFDGLLPEEERKERGHLNESLTFRRGSNNSFRINSKLLRNGIRQAEILKNNAHSLDNSDFRNIIDSNNTSPGFTRIKDDSLYQNDLVANIQTKPPTLQQDLSMQLQHCNWCKRYSFYRPYTINYAYSHSPFVQPQFESSDALENAQKKHPSIDDHPALPSIFLFKGWRIGNESSLTVAKGQEKVSESVDFKNNNQQSSSLEYGSKPAPGIVLRPGRKNSEINYHPDLVPNSFSSSYQPVKGGSVQMTRANQVGRFNSQTSFSKGQISTAPNKHFSIQNGRQQSSIWDVYQEYDSRKPRPGIQSPTRQASFSGITSIRNAPGSGRHASNQPLSTKAKLPISSPLTQAFVSRVTPSVLTKNETTDNCALKLQNKSPDFLQTLGLCNQTVSSSHFQIKSPGYPGPFYADMKCLYFIHRNDASRCGLLLAIEMLDLPGHPPCNETFLSVAGRHFCGTEAKGFKVVIPFSPKTPIRLEFRSDSFHSGAGFALIGEQIRCDSSFHPDEAPRIESSLRQPTTTTTKTTASGTTQPTQFSSKPVPLTQLSRFPGGSAGTSLWKPESAHRISGFQEKGVTRLKPVFRSPIAPLSLNHNRGYLTLPWVGFRESRFPPNKRGYEYVRRRKG